MLSCWLSCSAPADQPQDISPTKPTVTDPFMGLTPTAEPQLLAPDFIATALVEYNGTFSPDGKELFYTAEVAGRGLILHTVLQASNQWTTPRIASFSGPSSDYDPLFAPDGNRLYFSSERGLDGSPQLGTTHIWYLDKTADGWGEPQPLELTNQGDYYSSITQDGSIYFNVWNNGDIYKATPVDTGYEVAALPESINGGRDVGDPFIAPDESYIIFRGYLDGGLGRGDLYISFKEGEAWSEPKNLGAPINSSGRDICPYVTTDGKIFLFASDRLTEYFSTQPNDSTEGIREKLASWDNGNSNIYYMTTDFIEELRNE